MIAMYQTNSSAMLSFSHFRVRRQCVAKTQETGLSGLLDTH